MHSSASNFSYMMLSVSLHGVSGIRIRPLQSLRVWSVTYYGAGGKVSLESRS